MVHGNVTGWPATTTRSCGCWENMVSTPLKQEKKRFNGRRWMAFQSMQEMKGWRSKRGLYPETVAAGAKTTRPLPPISLKPLVSIANKRRFLLHPGGSGAGPAPVQRDSHHALTCFIYKALSPYRWAPGSQITRSCLPTLLEGPALTAASTPVFQLRNRY